MSGQVVLMNMFRVRCIIEELDHSQYLDQPDTAERYLHELSDLHQNFDCGVHVAMTAQEHAVKLETCQQDPEKHKLTHILIESVRRHFGDIHDKLFEYIAGLKIKESGMKQWEVLNNAIHLTPRLYSGVVQVCIGSHACVITHVGTCLIGGRIIGCAHNCRCCVGLCLIKKQF